MTRRLRSSSAHRKGARRGPRRQMPRPRTAVGCGMDIVELTRFRQAVRRGGSAFLRRVFTDGERAYARKYRDPMPHLAARFAGKEAMVKALSQFNGSIPPSYKDIEIRSDRMGRPCVRLRGSAGKGRYVCSISLTHTQRIAAAWALVSQ